MINRSESRLIALEQRNQAERTQRKANPPAPIPASEMKKQVRKAG